MLHVFSSEFYEEITWVTDNYIFELICISQFCLLLANILKLAWLL